MPRVGVETVDIAVHAVLLDHEHLATRGQHSVDLGGREVVEGFPAPFDGRMLRGVGMLGLGSWQDASEESSPEGAVIAELCRECACTGIAAPAIAASAALVIPRTAVLWWFVRGTMTRTPRMTRQPRLNCPTKPARRDVPDIRSGSSARQMKRPDHHQRPFRLPSALHARRPRAIACVEDARCECQAG